MTPTDAVEQYKARIPKAIARVQALSGEELRRRVFPALVYHAFAE